MFPPKPSKKVRKVQMQNANMQKTTGLKGDVCPTLGDLAVELSKVHVNSSQLAKTPCMPFFSNSPDWRALRNGKQNF